MKKKAKTKQQQQQRKLKRQSAREKVYLLELPYIHTLFWKAKLLQSFLEKFLVLATKNPYVCVYIIYTPKCLYNTILIALFKIAPNEILPKYLSTVFQIKNWCYIHTNEYTESNKNEWSTAMYSCIDNSDKHNIKQKKP